MNNEILSHFQAVFGIVLFPGFAFLVLLSFVYAYVDRVVHARLQNRQGPPWFQPVADIVKLFGKEDVVPEDADQTMFRIMPLIGLAGAVTAFLYIPTWGLSAPYSFYGDVIVVVYLLTLPTLAIFLGGWFSTSLYAMIGALRSQTQFYSYEVPLFLAVLAPALLANTWSLSEMTAFYNAHPAYTLVNVLGMVVAMVSLLGKLERVPFDSPEAETEIVAGAFTEYSGRRLAFFKLTLDIELVVGASLIAAVYLPFGLNLPVPYAVAVVLGFILYILKITAVVLVLTLLRTVFARIRIDQMVRFCWTVLAPAAFLQVVISLVVKGLLHP